MNVTRYIDIFDKTTERLIEQVNVSHIELEVWKSIFNFYDNDPEFVMVYPITATQAKKIKDYLSIDFDFENFIYDISA